MPCFDVMSGVTGGGSLCLGSAALNLISPSLNKVWGGEINPREARARGDLEINSLLSSKKGRLYLRFIVATALLISLAYAVVVLAANPSATPRIVTGQNSTIGENATVAKATEQLFGYANILTIVLSLPSLRSVSFTNTNGTFEENSTFKWFKRTLYQPQNRSLVGYWKMDGNANDFFRYWNKIFNRRVRIL